MSVIVKGMEMPKNCGKCRFAGICGVHGIEEWPDIESIMFNDIIGIDGRRDKDCPLRPLPEKHGDLVDINQEVNIEYFDDMNQEWSLKAGTVAEALSVCEEFPETIVEAEGE